MIFVKKSGHFRICIAAFLAGAILKRAGLETYLSIEGLANYLGIAEKTVRKYVLNHAIPYHKIMKIICYGYEMLCYSAVAGRSAPMLYFLCLPFLRLYLLLMAGESYKRRIWYCPCTACRQQRAGRWMAAWQQLHQQLWLWGRRETMRGGGQKRPPGWRTAEYNTAFDFALAFANLRNTRYVTGRIKDRATLPLNPHNPLVFPRIRGGPFGACPFFLNGTPRRGKTALRLAVPLKGIIALWLRWSVLIGF